MGAGENRSVGCSWRSGIDEGGASQSVLRRVDR